MEDPGDGFIGLLEIDYQHMAIAAGLMFVNMFLAAVFQLGVTIDLFIATLRCAAQLIVMGYILVEVFALNHPALVFGLALIMTTLGAVEASIKTEYRYTGILFRFWIALVLAGFTILLFGLLVIIGVEPFYEAQYLIPIIGMQLGNGVPAVAIGVDRCLSSVKENRDILEVYIAMGADRIEASQDVLADSVRAGAITILNYLSVTGIVYIPGTMSGLVLTGVDPPLAARYQIVLLYIIATTCFFATVIAVFLSIMKLFDKTGSLDLSILKKEDKGYDVLYFTLLQLREGVKSCTVRCLVCFCCIHDKKHNKHLQDDAMKIPDFSVNSEEQGHLVDARSR